MDRKGFPSSVKQKNRNLIKYSHLWKINCISLKHKYCGAQFKQNMYHKECSNVWSFLGKFWPWHKPRQNENFIRITTFSYLNRCRLSLVLFILQFDLLKTDKFFVRFLITTVKNGLVETCGRKYASEVRFEVW